MHKLECPHCQAAFEKPTLDRARQALQMHIGRKHTGTIPNATLERQRANLARANEVRLAKQKETAAVRRTSTTAEMQVKPKRVSTKRVQPRPVTAEIKINFCPNCGFDIRKAAIGIVLGQNHSSHD